MAFAVKIHNGLPFQEEGRQNKAIPADLRPEIHVCVCAPVLMMRAFLSGYFPRK